MIPKGSKKPTSRYKFIDQVLSVEGQRCFSEQAYIGAVNTKVKLSDKLAKIVPYGETLKKVWFVDPDIVAKNIPVWTPALAARGRALIDVGGPRTLRGR